MATIRWRRRACTTTRSSGVQSAPVPTSPGSGANTKVAEFQKRYPKAAVRDFDGNPRRITEMDALVGYLQMLGTLVDFKLYDDKANLR